MDNRFSVLVNSSDGFEDCWSPFFKLYKKYWPAANVAVFLNTEKKQWSYEGMNLRCTAVQPENVPRLTWSECLLAALEQIDTPLVLYFQEDYFIHQPVRDDVVNDCAAYMLANPEVKHIALTRQGSAGPFEPYADQRFWTIRRNARYRISTQAALWRVDTLKSYLRAEENGWMFEIFGTWRARRRNECFLVANFSEANGGPAIDYLHTGIIKGKWLPAITEVFRKNDIVVDFTVRGFYKRKNFVMNKIETAQKLLANKRYFMKQFIGGFLP